MLKIKSGVTMIHLARILTVACLTASMPSFAAVTYELDIGPQRLATALQQFAKQSGLQIVYFGKVAEGFNAEGVKGKLTAEEALGRLLAGTGLSFEALDGETVAISARAQDGEKISWSSQGDREVRLVQGGTQTSGEQGDSAAQGNEPAPPEQLAAADSARGLEEIVVTAQKRIERLQDVPVPVATISGESLVGSNQLQLQDYYTRIPGLNLTTSANTYSGAILSIRGVTSGLFNDNTVGIVVDDVPYGSTSAIGPGEVVPEIDPSDLARIEVLRGPQGTLYGASSIGGLLKYVTVDPSLDRVSGRLQTGLSSIRNGDEVGYTARGSVNVPLNDSWAIRASASYRRDPGYIDDPVHGFEGVNSLDVATGRLSALWRPSENFSIKLSALLNDSEADGSTYVTLPLLGDLQQSTVPNSGGYSKELQVYSANLSARLGRFDLTSISAYSINDNEFSFDLTPRLGGAPQFFFPGSGGGPSIQVLDSTKFTQEIRVSTSIGPRVEWLLGGFYNDEEATQHQRILAANFTTGAPMGELAFFDFPNTFEEYAAFTDFTFRIDTRFDVQIGGRYSRNEQSLIQTNIGPIFPGGVQIRPEIKTEDDSFTYLLTPRFRVSADLMAYARLASGYRPGGPNTNAALGVPPQFGPDKTESYEIGIKGKVFDQALSFDASVYHIDWKDIQISLQEPIIRAGYKDNAGRAKSQGLDLSLEARPRKGLAIAVWGAWNFAELAEALPATSTVRGASGARLPFSSRFSGHLSLDQQFPLMSRAVGFVGGSVSYVGERRGPFVGATQTRAALPAYSKIDLRAGVEYEAWTANLFLNNIADKRAVLNADATMISYIQPRTVGFAISRAF